MNRIAKADVQALDRSGVSADISHREKEKSAANVGDHALGLHVTTNEQYPGALFQHSLPTSYPYNRSPVRASVTRA